jgi:hypothetical protein
MKVWVEWLGTSMFVIVFFSCRYQGDFVQFAQNSVGFFSSSISSLEVSVAGSLVS